MAATFFRFVRQPSRPTSPRPAANTPRNFAPASRAFFYRAVENSELSQHFRAVLASQIEEVCEHLLTKAYPCFTRLRNSRSRKKAVARTIIFPGRISPSLFLNGSVRTRPPVRRPYDCRPRKRHVWGTKAKPFGRLPYRPAALLSVRPSRI
jgi:hypothetical protein